MIGRLACAVLVSVVLLASHVDPGLTEGTARRSRSLAGELLVATPELRDPRFARTVIYLIRHDDRGAQGFILNRPLRALPLAGLLDQLGMDSSGVTGTIRLHAGGPVEPRRFFVLHTSDYAGTGTEVVKDGVSMSSEPDVLGAIASGRGPRRVRLLVGYVGWGPGQLEAEMEAGAWIRAGADEALVFNEDYDQKWEKAQARQKIDL